MTTTPTEWITSFQVNTSSTGFQGQHDIVGLSNGNFLVVFTDDSGTVGSGSGRDIVGVIYDALGNIVKTAFQVNSDRSADSEELPSVAAANDGGFYIAYEDRNTNGQTLYAERYNADGNLIGSVDAVVQSDPGTEFVSRPQITVDQSDNSVFVSYQFSDGNDDSIRGKAFDANLNVAAGTPTDGHIIQTDDDPAGSAGPFSNESAVLNNGNYVTVHTEFDSDQGIEVQQSNGTTGANTTNINVLSTGTNGVIDFDPQIAALTGGGYVVVWVEDEAGNDNIKAQRYSASNAAQGAEITVVDTGNNYNSPDVIGLEDGGFFVIARDSTDNRLEGTRFDASGVQVGIQMFNMESVNTPTNPELSLTTDGRILVAWTDSLGNIRSEIWDPRDTTINADVGDGQITARATDDTNLNGTNTAETLYGRSGDDTINPGFGDDSVSGGFGSDTLDLSYSAPSGGIALTQSWNVNLNTQVAQRFVLGLAETNTLNSIENVIGSGWADTIIGNGASNTLNGGNGADSISGGGGSDSILGGSGNDRINGGFGTDQIDAGSGNDTIIGGDGENVDSVDGGTGFDIVDVSAENGTAVTVDLQAGTWDGIGAAQDIDNIEWFIGTQVNDTIGGSSNGETLSGDDGNDTITGLGGNDLLEGGDGDDSIDGGADADTIDGGTGNDNMQGGTGNDVFFLRENEGADTINGGSGENLLDLSKSNAGWTITDSGGSSTGTSSLLHSALDALIGTDFGDTISESSIDSIDAGAGDDTVITNGANVSNETFDGGSGIDTLDFSVDTSNIVFNMDVGLFTGTAGAFNFENAIGGLGNDRITGTTGDNIINGGEGIDTLRGQAGNDFIGGGIGADSIDGGSGDDTLNGAADNDTITGGAGFDSINGGGGNDTIDGGSGGDTINGASDNDQISGGAGADSLIGGNGDDTLDGGNAADDLSGGNGNDNLNGGIGADFLDGGNNDDTVNGGNQGDIVNGGSGNDNVIGGGGSDTMDGGSGNDNLNGGLGNDTMNGGIGNDTLRGLDGSDTLDGGDGSDRLIGGNGNDTFLFSSPTHGADTIIDWDVGFGSDTIAVDGMAFGGLAAGTLSAANFVVGNSAADANDFFIYNSANGRLFYDADGSGGGGQVLIATLTGAPLISNTDIEVV